MIIGKALFCLVSYHQNTAFGLEGGPVVAEFWHVPKHLNHCGRYEMQPVDVNAAFVVSRL